MADQRLNTRYRYLVWGVLFGSSFPIIATVIACIDTEGAVSIQKCLGLHVTNPLLWIIDLAPVILGLFSYYLGRNAEYYLAIQEQRRLDAEKYLHNLRSQNKELSELNGALDSLLYTASHDLKTPVVNFRSLGMMLRQLIESDSEPQMIHQALHRLEASTDQFERIIEDLLQLSQIDAHFAEGYSIVNLQECARRSLESIKEETEAKKVTVELDISGVEQLNFPPRSLDRLLTNLIDNAVKYSSPDRTPKVRIFTERKGEQIVLNIRDNGIGIDLERHRNKLFKMFKRLNNHSGGSGLGLYIVKRIMDKSGGSIDVQSELGKGTLFSLSIPQPVQK